MLNEPRKDPRLKILERPSDEDDDAIDFPHPILRDEALVGVELSELLDNIPKIATVKELVKDTAKAVELWRDLDRRYARSSWAALMRKPVAQLLTFAKAMEIVDQNLMEAAVISDEQGGRDSRQFLANVAEAHYHCKSMKQDFDKTTVLRDCLEELGQLCDGISPDICAQKLEKNISGWEKMLRTWKISWRNVPDDALRMIQMHDLLKRLDPRHMALQTHHQIVESLRIYLDVRTRTVEITRTSPVTDSHIEQIKRGQRRLKKTAGLPSTLHPAFEPAKRPWEAFFAMVRIQIHNSLQDLMRKQQSS